VCLRDGLAANRCQSSAHAQAGDLPKRRLSFQIPRGSRCMADEDDEQAAQSAELEPRAPEENDVVLLCRRLNELGARYVVVGGFAIILAGLPRTTGDIDLIVATDLENEARVYRAL